MAADDAPVRWAATPPRRRWALAAAAVVVLAAALVALTAGQTEGRTVTRTVTAAPPSPAPTTDASGCPLDVRCTVTTAAPTAASAAVLAAFAGAELVAASTTTGVSDHHVYRYLMMFGLSGGNTLTVWSQSVPGMPATRDGTVSSPRTQIDLDGNTRTTAWLTTVRHSADRGRSVVVELNSVGSAPPDRNPVVWLAGDNRLELS